MKTPSIKKIVFFTLLFCVFSMVALLGSVFGIRIFVVEVFRIHAASMAPSLVPGDLLLVNKWRRVPERGDIVVFRYPPNPSITYVKRVVGMPGETVEVRNNEVWINDQPMPIVSGPAVTIDSGGCSPENRDSKIESLGDHDVHIVSGPYPGPFSDTGPSLVPDGSYFAMGDNRDNSEDSRVWGTVPADLVLGTAWLRISVLQYCGERIEMD